MKKGFLDKGEHAYAHVFTPVGILHILNFDSVGLGISIFNQFHVFVTHTNGGE